MLCLGQKRHLLLLGLRAPYRSQQRLRYALRPSQPLLLSHSLASFSNWRLETSPLKASYSRPMVKAPPSYVTA